MTGQEKSFERVNQKRRTRAELLRAAQDLTAKGQQPSVADVADHAGISRATAYRYFSTPEDMIREAALDAVARGISIELPKEGDGVASVPLRVESVVRQVYDMVETNEAMFRALLASSVSGKGEAKRGARRVAWLTAALEPLRQTLPPDEFRRLVHGLALMTGIETLVVLKDVCDLKSGEAQEVVLWAAKVLVAGALGGAVETAGEWASHGPR